MRGEFLHANSRALRIAVLVSATSGCRVPAPSDGADTHPSLDSAEVDTTPLDSGSPPPDDDGMLLIADTGNARLLLVERSTGVLRQTLSLAQLLPDRCATEPDGESPLCLVFGTHWDEPLGQPDRKGLVVVFAVNHSPTWAPGGLIQLRAGTPAVEERWAELLAFPFDETLDESCAGPGPTESLCRPSKPHVMDRIASTDEVVIADTLHNRVLRLEQPVDGARGQVQQVLDASSTGWAEARWPNGVQVIEESDRVFALVTYKGADPDVTGTKNTGRIGLWDLTEPTSPELIWFFPEDGYLAAVHNAAVQESGGERMLLYGHSQGASDDFAESDDGTVGLARLDDTDLTIPPVYVADFQTDGDPELGFVREAELVNDGTRLLVTDAGCEGPASACGKRARVLELELSLPDPPGTSGAFSSDHSQQVFVQLPVAAIRYAEGLSYTFETDLLTGSVAEEVEEIMASLSASR